MCSAKSTATSLAVPGGMVFHWELCRHLKTGFAKKVLGRFKTFSSHEIEMQVVSYKEQLDKMYYGLTKESQELAFCLAE